MADQKTHQHGAHHQDWAARKAAGDAAMAAVRAEHAARRDKHKALLAANRDAIQKASVLVLGAIEVGKRRKQPAVLRAAKTKS